MKIRKQELIITIGFFVLGVAILVLMPYQVSPRYFTANNTSGVRMATTTFPTLTAWLIIISSGLYLLGIGVRCIQAKMAGQEIAFENGKRMYLIPVIAVAVGIFIYVFLLRILGFIIDTMIFTALIGLYLKSSKLEIVISSLVIPIAAYFIFGLMYVNLPSGILPF